MDVFKEVYTAKETGEVLETVQETMHLIYNSQYDSQTEEWGCKKHASSLLIRRGQYYEKITYHYNINHTSHNHLY